jgi:hypothetical protein
VEEDTTAILGSAVWALAVEGGWVVHAVEEFKDLAIADLLGVVRDLCGFGVWFESLVPGSSASFSELGNKR